MKPRIYRQGLIWAVLIGNTCQICGTWHQALAFALYGKKPYIRV